MNNIQNKLLVFPEHEQEYKKIIAIWLVFLVSMQFFWGSQTEFFLQLLRVVISTYIISYICVRISVKNPSHMRSFAAYAIIQIFVTPIQILFHSNNLSILVAMSVLISFFVFKAFFKLKYIETTIFMLYFLSFSYIVFVLIPRLWNLI